MKRFRIRSFPAPYFPAFGQREYGEKNSEYRHFSSSENDDIAETFDDIFASVALSLIILYYQDPFIDSDQTEKRIGHPILRIVEQHKSHSSIIAINNQYVDK